MAKSIRAGRITGAKPVPGGIISVEVEYPIAEETVKTLGINQIVTLANSIKPSIQASIGRSVGRSWRLAQLTRRTGKLIANALRNFQVIIDSGTLSNRIEITAIWNAPTIQYFFAQLFGRPEINLAPHDFIQLDSAAANEIQILLNTVLESRTREQQQKKKRQIRPRRVGITHLSPFRARRELRKAGVSAATARIFVAGTLGRGIPITKLIEALRDPGVVRQIKRGERVEFGE